MKDNVKVAVIQAFTSSVYDKEKNLQYHIDKIMSLKDEGPDLIVFPELSVSGYVRGWSPQNVREYWELGSEPVPGYSTNKIIEAAREVGAYVVFGIAERTNADMVCYNSAVLVGPEGLIGVNRKIHLPLMEKEYFRQGTEPMVYDTKIGKIGMILGYELFFPESTRMVAVKGGEICVYMGFVAEKKDGVGGIGLGEEKQYLSNTAPRIRAIENQIHFIFCSSGGAHDMGPAQGMWHGIGHSKIVDNFGNVLAESLSENEDLVLAEINGKELIHGRTAYPLLHDRRPAMYTSLIDKNM